ncbi:mariner Mos1 transposase [Trichonephila clavipes]|nr:mariner Mos1 transposase [Trichonephila clavipes]
MNLNILAFVFKNEVHCKMCNSGLDMQVLKGKVGLAIAFVLKCFACPYRVEFFSSNFHEGTQIATINTRFVYAMRSIGKGVEAGRMFCDIMNLPQPPRRFYPYAIVLDGAWQKRGYTSLNGVVTVTSIDTGKVIDVDILSKYCACKNLPFHEKDCERNYVGSSGAKEIQEQLNVDQSTVSRRLKATGKIIKVGRWVSHELKDRQQENRKFVCEMLLACHKRKIYFHRIVTGDKKWIYFDNPKRNRSYVDPRQPPKSTARPNRLGRKTLLCIFWDQKVPIYYELLKPAETVNTDCYKQQLI